MLSLNSSITFGITLPTPSLVIANIRNIKHVSHFNRLPSGSSDAADRCGSGFTRAFEVAVLAYRIDCLIDTMRNEVQLITYANRFGGHTLRQLHDLLKGPLQGVFGGVHLLPFFLRVD